MIAKSGGLKPLLPPLFRRLCVDENPYLTTHHIACGQGIRYRPGSADMAGTSYERLNYHKNKALKEWNYYERGTLILTQKWKQLQIR